MADSRVWLLVQVGVERETLTEDEARLLLHEACDALAERGGPVLGLWGYNLDGSETDPSSRFGSPPSEDSGA